ncbi:MAG TPA: HAMP domain-containing sensor histidine kinase, partial [Allosphingosinicella sp.]|jgi:signal transduction histidine kinase|nr:HAMP domain-containing sensor histidine kinase [Allosphingosinicella sp.]
MASAPEDAATDPQAPALRVADAHRAPGFTVDLDLVGLPAAAAPAELLEAVLETLVENSRQAGASRVAIGGRAEGTKVRIKVQDDGQGIAEADRERIFEPFHTSRRGEGGSGLGLSIARSLLTACGGTIEAERSEAGACFEITLPVAS